MKTFLKRLLAGMLILGMLLSLSGCVTPVPQDLGNVCAVFQQNKSWFWAAQRSQRRWGVPMSTLMAIMYQESHFHATIKPPRERLLWVIPWRRPTSADGYSQATYDTWWQYQDYTDNFAARRSKFEDAIDFVGWYCNMAHKRLGIPLNNTFELYLAYHEGIEGYAARTYRRKRWLIDIARRVQRQAERYHYQLVRCESRLAQRPWF